MGTCWQHDVSQFTVVTAIRSNPPYLTHEDTHQVITISQPFKVAQNKSSF